MMSPSRQHERERISKSLDDSSKAASPNRSQGKFMTVQELQRFASDGLMIPSAPIQDSQTKVINASIDRVWRIQTDVDHWANWYAYLRNAKLVGPFGPGAKLSYGGFPKHNLVIAKVDNPRLVMIYGTYMASPQLRDGISSHFPKRRLRLRSPSPQWVFCSLSCTARTSSASILLDGSKSSKLKLRADGMSEFRGSTKQVNDQSGERTCE